MCFAPVDGLPPLGVGSRHRMSATVQGGKQQHATGDIHNRRSRRHSMSGAAGAFLLPSSRSQRPVSDQLKHMVPKLENRAQRGFGVAASMHEERFQHTKSCRPAGKLADVDFTEQDAHSRPHVAIAHVRTPSHREKSDADFQPFDNHKTSRRRLTVCLNGALVNADVPFEVCFLCCRGDMRESVFLRLRSRCRPVGGQKRADETSNRLVADLTSTKTSAA